ncbi:hypothetical protein FLA_1446 [Filimonas lacunae]|nr:hypothetical protein FLA_1446 [Filimonas lacunae]
MRTLLGVASALFAYTVANAQTDTTTKHTDSTVISPLYFHSQLKSMHLWRGLAVTNTATLAIDGGISTRDQKLKAGIWGGYGLTGVYKEFDYYVAYSPLKNLTFAVWDIYNYSTDATWNNHNFFDYKDSTSGHFIDVSANWKVSEKLPLTLYWATVVHGRDRGVLNQKNLYSTYVQASYPVVQNKNVNFDLIVGGAFAFRHDEGYKNNFYGPNDGFTNIGFKLTRVLELGKYKIPVSAQPSWNPVRKAGNIQLAVDLF